MSNSKFEEMIIEDAADLQKFYRLMNYFGNMPEDLNYFNISFLLYRGDILSLDFIPKVQNIVPTLSDLLNNFSIESIWDIAFCIDIGEHVRHETEKIQSIEKIKEIINKRKINEKQYLPFVKESKGVFLWQHQLTNFLNLFFVNKEVSYHFMKSFNHKRASVQKRLQEFDMPIGKSVYDYIWNHAFGQVFYPARFEKAHYIWNVINGQKVLKHPIDEISVYGERITVWPTTRLKMAGWGPYGRMLMDFEYDPEKMDNIDRYLENEHPDSVIDGIVSKERFCKARYKILWILKEPSDEEGGGWSLTEFLSQPKKVMPYARKSTLQPIIHVSYGILKGPVPYAELPDSTGIIDILTEISVINVNKLPGGSRSDPSILKAAYNEFKELLYIQISCISPDVIIGGNTLSLFMQDLNVQQSEIDKSHTDTFFFKKYNRLWIDAYHPGQTNLTQEKYYNQILEIFDKEHPS